MKQDKPKQTPPRTIRRSVEFEVELRGAFARNPKLDRRERGAFSKIMLMILKEYNDRHQLPGAK